MSEGHYIHLTGASVEETAEVLARRLIELGHEVEPGEDGVMLFDDASDEGIDVEIDAHDPPGFAAEKILDILEERGWVSLDDEAVSAEEEAEITDRLRKLGYIE